jgi:hypothetical protein
VKEQHDLYYFYALHTILANNKTIFPSLIINEPVVMGRKSNAAGEYDFFDSVLGEQLLDLRETEMQ